MKQLSFRFKTKVEFSVPVHNHAFVLRCLPTTRERQVVQAYLDLDPAVPYSLQEDNFGNCIAVGRIDEDHRKLTYLASGTAQVYSPEETQELGHVQELSAHPHFRFPSPLTQPSSELLSWASGNGYSKGGAPQDANAIKTEVQRLSHLVHTALAYEPGSTNVHTTAAQAFAQGKGVCQDFAHIMCAILRNWGLSARYTSGFTVGEGASHAWPEVFIDNAWYGVDPTRDCVCDDSYLILAVGRDWQDCPVERGTFIGNADQTQTVFMEVKEK